MEDEGVLSGMQADAGGLSVGNTAGAGAGDRPAVRISSICTTTTGEKAGTMM